jgi:hypothetical protein
MKFFFSPPANEDGQQFYTRYASLIPSLSRAGYLAQIVSGLTEWGILYALVYSSLAAFWPSYATAAGFIGATVGVLIIELGLRRLLPYSARAIIYRRWQKLDGWISAFVLTSAALLLAVSAFLSFNGARSLVDNITTPPAEATATATDSLATAETELVKAAWDSDADAVRDAYAVRLDAVKTSLQATVRRLDAQLATLRTREQTTGQKYTTRRAQVRQQIEDAKADRDEQLAALQNAREGELAELRERYRAQLDGITTGRDSSRAQIAQSNAEALRDHQQKVSQYGGGLAWFTVVCLFVLVVAITLKELHHAGAGITEQTEPDAYTFEAGPLAAFTSALSTRLNRAVYGIVHHIERTTPDAPEPVDAPTIWERSSTLKLRKPQGAVQRTVKPLKPLKGQPAAPAAQRGQIGFVRRPQTPPDATNDAQTGKALTQCVNDAQTDAQTQGKKGTCEHCGKDYIKRTTWQKFCSPECRKDHHATKHNGTPYDPTRKPWKG